MVEFLVTNDSSALGKTVAAQEGPLFALSDYQFAVFALIALYSRRPRRRLRRQEITLLVELEYGFAVWIT